MPKLTEKDVNHGYGVFSFKGIDYTSHRAAYICFKGDIPEGMHIMHSCDNRRCCNPDHLSAGTNEDNRADSVSKHRQSRGEHRYSAKLTCENVKEILDDDRAQTVIAREYGISPSIISKIKAGKAWKEVSRD